MKTHLERRSTKELGDAGMVASSSSSSSSWTNEPQHPRVVLLTGELRRAVVERLTPASGRNFSGVVLTQIVHDASRESGSSVPRNSGVPLSPPSARTGRTDHRVKRGPRRRRVARWTTRGAIPTRTPARRTSNMEAPVLDRTSSRPRRRGAPERTYLSGNFCS